MTATHHGPAPSDDAVGTQILSFMLTDIVGSTALWDTAPEAMERALRRHDELVDDIVGQHRGERIRPRGEGDSSFSVFGSAVDAVAASVELQRALTHEPWPTGARILVRAGIHTGEAIPRESDYYGSTVNRAARIRGLALGNQVLVSQTTAELVEGQLTSSVSFVELGTRKLAGLGRPERIFAVVGSGLLGVAPERAVGGGGVLPLPPAVEAPSDPMLGRDRELDAIGDAYERTRTDGVPHAVFVVGSPGIGKTTLVAGAARRLHGRGASVAYGQADDAIGIAYQPFVRALGVLIDHLPTDALAVHVANHGAQLARLVPDLARRTGIAPEAVAVSSGTDPYLLFGAVAHLLGLEADDQPLVLLLEDLHWADSQTIQLLRYLFTTARPHPILVLATYRDTDIGPDDPLARLVSDLSPTVSERIHLHGLDRDAVLTLTRERCDNPAAADRVASLIHRDTNGNPFLAREVLRHLVTTKQLSDAAHMDDGVSLARLGVPDTVRELVQRRVAHLGPKVESLLPVAALIGREFDLDLLTAVVAQPEVDVLEDLEAAGTAALVDESTERLGEFAFTHSIVHQSLCEQFGPTRQHRWRVRIAQTLEQLSADDPDARADDLARRGSRRATPTPRRRSATRSGPVSSPSSGSLPTTASSGSRRHSIGSPRAAPRPIPCAPKCSSASATPSGKPGVAAIATRSSKPPRRPARKETATC